MSGLTFSNDAAEKLIAAYSSADLVRQRDATLQRLNLRPGEHVIDIGCGPGFLCESMAAAISPTGRVVGIDISEDLINFATEHKSSESIEYRAGNAMALPVDAEQFDVAVSTQVIEYVADADAALYEISRVLRPAGRAKRILARQVATYASATVQFSMAGVRRRHCHARCRHFMDAGVPGESLRARSGQSPRAQLAARSDHREGGPARNTRHRRRDRGHPRGLKSIHDHPRAYDRAAAFAPAMTSISRRFSRPARSTASPLKSTRTPGGA
jgi:SAM-dependent methyltransferase